MLLSGLGSPPSLFPDPASIWSLGEATALNPVGPWTISNEDDPLLESYGFIGGWAGGHILSSMFFFDPVEAISRIVYQTSTGEPADGDKIGWTDNAYSTHGTQLFAAADGTLGDPFVVHDGTNYHLFYALKVASTWYVYKRHASTWAGLASDVTATQLFEGGSMGLFKYAGIWYMVFGKWDVDKNKIYMAVSPDLSTWTPMFGGDPVFSPTETYHQYGAQDPSVYIEDGVAYVYYSGIEDAVDPNADTKICLVTVDLDITDNGEPAPTTEPAKQIDFLLSGIRDTTTDAPLANGRVFTYLSGSTTLTNLWLNRDKTEYATNPIILDAAGRAEVYGDGIYDFQIWNTEKIVASYSHLEYRTKDISDDSGTVDNGTLAPFLHVEYQVGSSVDGGVASDGINIRKLNVTVYNTIDGALLSANQVIIPAGTYDYDAFGVLYNDTDGDATFHQLILHNLSAGENLKLGPTQKIKTAGIVDIARVGGRFTVEALTTLELRHWIKAFSGHVSALGVPNFHDTNVYAGLKLWKVA